MVLSVPSAPGHVRLLSRGIEMAFRPGQLLILTSTVPAELTVDRVCETVQLNIPFSALGHDVRSVVRTLRPVATSSVLVRTTALFIRRFVQAGSTAVADGDVAAQQGIVGLVNALLRQQSYRAHRLDDNTLTVRDRTTELIELHYRDPEFDASRVADELHMSRRQLYRHFAQAGESLADMIARRRLEEVCDLLVEQPGMGLEEVAHAVGFSSVSTMRNRFRAEYGMAPTEYRSGPLASSPGTTWQRAADSGEPAASLNP